MQINKIVAVLLVWAFVSGSIIRIINDVNKTTPTIPIKVYVEFASALNEKYVDADCEIDSNPKILIE